jgi:hypothetical protein
MKPWFLDYELEQHDLQRTLTVFAKDRAVLVHDLKAMVLFTVFVRDRVVLGHDLKLWFHLRCSLEIVLFC